MIQKIKRFVVLTIASLGLLSPGLVPALAGTAFADNITNSVCSGTNQAANSSSSGLNGSNCGSAGANGTTDLSSIAAKIVNIFSIIVGIVAVVMIVYGGFRYITSGGDSGRVGGAKNTLIYAIVGLVIVALAQFLVHYVLNTANNSGLQP